MDLPRIMNVMLGSWLIATPWLWNHTASQQMNAWIVGSLAVSIALIAVLRGPLRYLNTLLGAWLLASIWVLPTVSDATRWNNAILAVAILLISLLPSSADREYEASLGRRPALRRP